MKQRAILYAFLSFLFFSCKTKKEFSIKEHFVKNGRIIIRIPTDYKLVRITGGEDDIYKYIYRDSSLIYFTDRSSGGPNYENIKKGGLYDQLLTAELDRDSVTLSGTDERGLYWKYHFYGTFGIGYLNASLDRKAIFEKVIDNVEKK